VNLPAPSRWPDKIVFNQNTVGHRDSASMNCEQHAATTSSYHLDKRMRLQNIMTLHVRRPDKRAEPFVCP